MGWKFSGDIDFAGVFRYGQDFAALSGEVKDEARNVQSHLLKPDSGVKEAFGGIDADLISGVETVDFSTDYMTGFEPIDYEAVSGVVTVCRDYILTETEARFWVKFFEARGASSVRVRCYGIGHGLALLPDPSTTYTAREIVKDRAAAKRKADRTQANEVNFPPCADWVRRAELEREPEAWLRHYLPDWFTAGFGDVHRHIIERFQFARRAGEIATEVCPRGSGKTTIARGMLIMSLLTESEQTLLVVCAKKSMALSSVKIMLDGIVGSAAIAEDYPEVYYPLKTALEKRQAARHLTYDGTPCHIELNNERVTLPTITGYPRTGNSLIPLGFDANFRGINRQSHHTRRTLRPTLILIDDILKAGEEKNPRISEQKLKVITQDICGLQGHTGDRMGMIVLGTITAAGDAVDQLTNAEIYPQFRANVTPAVLSWPDWTEKEVWNDAWKRYWTVRDSEQTEDRTLSNEHYLKHRDELESGFSIYWDVKQKGELTSVQHFMLIRRRAGAVGFDVEYQNKPPRGTVAGLSVNVYDLIKQLNGRKEFEIEEGARLTCSADVNFYGITYCFGAVSAAGAASVVHYGIWTPEGRRMIHDPQKPWATEKEAITAAVKGFCDYVKGMGYPVSVLTVDCGDWMETILNAVRECQGASYPFEIYPTRGVHDEQFARYKVNHSGELIQNAVMRAYWNVGNSRYWILLVNTGIWGESTLTGLRLSQGQPGAVSIWGTVDRQNFHADFFRQLCAQKLMGKRQGRGIGFMYDWEVKGRNDYFDAVTYFRAAAGFFNRSALGIGDRRDLNPESRKPSSTVTYDASFEYGENF